MYFPKGFSRELSIELGELVQQAYAQYAAFENGETWKLPQGYLLHTELSYVWTPGKALEKGRRNFDIVLKAAGRLKDRKIVNIPVGFIAQGLNRTYLIFRGTITTTEWIRNFGISLSTYLVHSHGKVHDGFLQSYYLIRQKLIETIEKLDGKTQLFVAGHSLGAALATLSVPDIEDNSTLKVRSIYLYGSPRVGDATFAQAYNKSFAKRSYRIVNTSDIVTSIPLPAPIARLVGGYFSHVDTPVDMTIQNDDLEKNHAMKTYLSALMEQKKGPNIVAQILRRNV